MRAPSASGKQAGRQRGERGRKSKLCKVRSSSPMWNPHAPNGTISTCNFSDSTPKRHRLHGCACTGSLCGWASQRTFGSRSGGRALERCIRCMHWHESTRTRVTRALTCLPIHTHLCLCYCLIIFRVDHVCEQNLERGSEGAHGEERGEWGEGNVWGTRRGEGRMGGGKRVGGGPREKQEEGTSRSHASVVHCIHLSFFACLSVRTDKRTTR